jgi:HEPN domain-containing protein
MFFGDSALVLTMAERASPIRSQEKVAKALIFSLGGEGWGHAVTRLLRDLTDRLPIPERMFQPARRSGKHDTPTRHPNGFDAGAPSEHDTADEAQQAIRDAERGYDFCQQSLRRSRGRGRCSARACGVVEEMPGRGRCSLPLWLLRHRIGHTGH